MPTDEIITVLTEKTAPAGTDLIPIVDMSGSPETKKAQLLNLYKSLGTGAASSSTALFGDGSWKTVTGGGMTLIEEIALASPATEVIFASIPSGYRNLKIVGQARSDKAAVFDILQMEINSDTGANYAYSYLVWSGTTPGSAEVHNGTPFVPAWIPAATAAANRAGILVIEIPNYKGTTFYKQIMSSNTFMYGNPAEGFLWFGEWQNTSAITDIRLYSINDNLITGSVFSLYGLA